MYALVVVSNPSHNTDMPYSYRIPPHLIDRIQVGCRVAVPFGVSNRLLEGYVVDISPQCPVAEGKVKNIIDLLDSTSVFSEELIKLGKWMREEYLCTWAEALHCIIPSQFINRGKKYIFLAGGTVEKCDNPGYLKIIEVLQRLGGKAEADRLEEMVRVFNFQKLIKQMEERGLVTQRYMLESSVAPKFQLYVKLTAGEDKWNIRRNAFRQEAVLQFLKKEGGAGIRCSRVIEETGCTMGVLKALEKKGMVEIYTERVERTPDVHTGLIEDRVVKLTRQQVDAIESIKRMYNSGIREVLVHGVTGSGKTEVYMRLIGETIKRGKKAIVLVPEISLTPQMVEWYHKRFRNRAALFHSRLSPGERLDQWEGIRRGEFDVAIGARSAVFAPFEDIGLIIIDEEHEHTYKSESSPRYHARDIARERCRYYNALLVLGSATPSLETYYRAVKGDIGIVRLSQRVESRPLPQVEIVDMREELREGNRSIFSRQLKEEMERVLARGEQIMLLLNRRGYSTCVSCRDCGTVIKCPHCDISLTYHRQDNRLICHYCGYREMMPKKCKDCNSRRIKYMGLGTQKLEKEVERLFPGIRVLRMDVDSTRRKGAHFEILRAFKNREADILLGTQMIAKGLDFPGVTLVGVVLADFNLNLPDFRAAEKSFQLLTQVAGRAGRGNRPGKVIIQTYSPSHYSIEAAKSQQYGDFYQNEITIREQFGYPPFTRLINILITGEQLGDVAGCCEKMKVMVERGCERIGDPAFKIFGPSPALLSKIKGKYRWQLIIRGTHMDKIRKEIKKAWHEIVQKVPKGVNIILDMDPYNLM